ncbi:hypothetical protein PHYBOEH_002060 [Phytophthora boehmeriae]|uniref:Uncharacterized protein n=1 Tax=Phytophthora boehmeriae TaxID=109152 RepID=A0A8T1X661_9STRA|nr:hypothetical protein PHYBOEH_002060 [Phytophthora boehmeriae]
MARRPLPLLSLPRPTASTPLPFSHREICSPRVRTQLPHFSSSNAISASNAPSRHSQAQDVTKTPLEKAITNLQSAKERIRHSFDRMSQTDDLFEFELAETSRIVSNLEAEQQYLAHLYANLLDFSARQIQRFFRGHVGRRLFRQALVIRAVLRVQRKFREFHRRREETRTKSRVMYRKVLRGLRGVHGKNDLSHSELLTRVGHNLQVESQWRKAMGVGDTESDFITALYRKKSLLPQPKPASPIETTEDEKELVETVTADDDALGFEDNEGDVDTGDRNSSQRKIVIVAPRPRKQPAAVKKAATRFSREQLRHRQRMYTQRVHAENTKRVAAHAVVLDRQREADRQAEAQRKRLEEELRLQRVQNAQSLREDLERRGLQAIRDLHQKKDDEVRKEEQVTNRIAQAKKKIAVEVLSGQTQRILARNGGS